MKLVKVAFNFVVVAILAANTKGDDDTMDPECAVLGSKFDLCNSELEQGSVTCQKLEVYDQCIEDAFNGCDHEETLTEAKGAADTKRAAKAQGINCEITTTAQKEEETATQETQTEAETVKPEEKKPEPEVETPEPEEKPLPKCQDAITKAAEVQKCNDVIAQDSMCLQIQKAVDCVEEKVDCSEENFDIQIDRYLESFENFALDYGCIITYNGQRLEHRKKIGEA